MLGKSWNPSLAAKAKETEGLVEFVTSLLEKHRYKFMAAGQENMMRTTFLIAAKALRKTFMFHRTTVAW